MYLKLNHCATTISNPVLSYVRSGVCTIAVDSDEEIVALQLNQIGTNAKPGDTLKPQYLGQPYLQIVLPN